MTLRMLLKQLTLIMLLVLSEESEPIENEDIETTEEDHEDMMHHGEVIDDVLSRLPVIDHMHCGVHTFQ